MKNVNKWLTKENLCKFFRQASRPNNEKAEKLSGKDLMKSTACELVIYKSHDSLPEIIRFGQCLSF